MRTPAIFALTLLTFGSPLAAQQAPDPAARVARAVDSTVYWAHERFLADDALEGRAPATRGGLLAAKYIAAQFARLGLLPAGDGGTYFHRVPVISLTPSPDLRVLRKDGRTEGR